MSDEREWGAAPVLEPEETPTFGFLAFLKEIEHDPLGAEDLVACFLPLVEQTMDAHGRGKVAPFEGAGGVNVTHHRMWFREAGVNVPQLKDRAVAAVQASALLPLAVVEIVYQDRNKLILEPGEPVQRPSFVTGYAAWEHLVGHHDPLTDGYSLGLLLASVALRLDLSKRENLAEFVQHRLNLFALREDVHPGIQKLIVRLTEPDRQRRIQDLSQVVDYLENFRVGVGVDARPADRTGAVAGRETAVLEHLRNRLFDVSRRNRLIHFQPNQLTLNLTARSVPYLMAHQNLDAERLLMWQPEVAAHLREQRRLCLNRYLNLEPGSGVSEQLTRIRQAANRDEKEYGFSTLRLVIAFLRWHNLKDDGADRRRRVHSPLLMVPIRLQAERGVRDRFEIEPLSDRAEVNPALRHYLHLLYGLDLPESVELTEAAVKDFFNTLRGAIEHSAPDVDLVWKDRPEIRLTQQRERRKTTDERSLPRLVGESVRTRGEMDYCYKDREALSMLGWRLFHSRVTPSALPLEYGEYWKETVSSAEEDESNLYRWVFDSCSFTIGCFQDQKMTLWRDYDALLADGGRHPGLGELFSVKPAPRRGCEPEVPALEDQHLIAKADPTQISAIAWARSGRNLIIQGPPGTGKSQTITNLIADYVARGKRVLFVCEKRAALDVVYARLKKAGLHRQSILIHDAQADRKAFVEDLRESYEGIFGSGGALGGAGGLADAILPRLRELEGYAKAVQSPDPQAERSPLQLMDRFVELRSHFRELEPEEAEKLPNYGDWVRHGHALEEIAGMLRDLGERRVLASHPLRWLSPRCYEGEWRPGEIREALKRCGEAVEGLSSLLEDQPFELRSVPLGELPPLVEVAERCHYLSVHDLLGLLRSESFESRRLADLEADLMEAKREWEEIQTATAPWRAKLPRREAAEALNSARFLSQLQLPWTRGRFWELRGLLRREYDFNRHKVRPAWESLLGDLLTEYAVLERMKALGAQVEREFRVPSSGDLLRCHRELRAYQEAMPASLRAREFMHFLSRSGEARGVISALHLAGRALRELKGLEVFLPGYLSWNAPKLRAIHGAVLGALHQLPDLAPGLRALSCAPAGFREAVSSVELEPESLEAAIAQRDLSQGLGRTAELRRFHGEAYRRSCEQLAEAYDRWLEGNGARVVERGRRAFLRLHGDLLDRVGDEGKRRRFQEGCAVLEHQFRLTQRFQSIREIASQSREALMALKPVWLMSPLSISQALPLDPELFDVVIFDEASQVRLEDAVPSICRGKQFVVVGDEMQLPPTHFFATQALGGEDWVSYRDEEGGTRSYPLDAESLLSHAAQRLPSTLLGWHYRSRDEALISFSNHAFYRGDLLTIPAVSAAEQRMEPILVGRDADVASHVDAALQRTLSYHQMQGSVYRNQRNEAEADYIAGIVRELLRRRQEGGERLSLGVVAFSSSQQEAIERALEALARKDRDFERLLADEQERVQDGQHAGLFVKNLENVQGDERDIMILSLCFGPDEKGKTKLNLGPIIQQGGEKRLNVILSRAKRHMMVVSSLEPALLTNDWNPAAVCLRRFLEYAAAVSTGDTGTARRALAAVRGTVSDGGGGPVEVAPSGTVRTLAQALAERGYDVETRVGESKFRIDVAVRKPGESRFDLGILLDSEERYSVNDPLERAVLRPGILRAFGWRIHEVLSQDWYQDPDRVLGQIEALLSAGEGPGPRLRAEPGEETGNGEMARFCRESGAMVLT